MYANIQDIVKDAFLYDFNLIVEEFTLYQLLPPKSQTDLINLIFRDFLRNFEHFFGSCENGFRNEFVIQLFTRQFLAGETLQEINKEFQLMTLITQGEV